MRQPYDLPARRQSFKAQDLELGPVVEDAAEGMPPAVGQLALEQTEVREPCYLLVRPEGLDVRAIPN